VTEILRLDMSWLRFAPLTLTGVVVLGVLFGAVIQITNATEINIAATDPVQHLVTDFTALSVVQRILVGGSVLLACYVFIAMIGYIAVFWNFQLVSLGADALRVTRGLLSVRTTTISLARLRGVEISESLLLRAARSDRDRIARRPGCGARGLGALAASPSRRGLARRDVGARPIRRPMRGSASATRPSGTPAPLCSRDRWSRRSDRGHLPRHSSAERADLGLGFLIRAAPRRGTTRSRPLPQPRPSAGGGLAGDQDGNPGQAAQHHFHGRDHRLAGPSDVVPAPPGPDHVDCHDRSRAAALFGARRPCRGGTGTGCGRYGPSAPPVLASASPRLIGDQPPRLHPVALAHVFG
jgi:membrane protein YdbS with pleckstrin-like domain